jgi:hypothetical protein
MLELLLEKGFFIVSFFKYTSIEVQYSPKLVVVIYLTLWNPTSKFQLKVFDDIIQSGEFNNARFCFIDIEKEIAKCKALSFVFNSGLFFLLEYMQHQPFSFIGMERF